MQAARLLSVLLKIMSALGNLGKPSADMAALGGQRYNIVNWNSNVGPLTRLLHILIKFAAISINSINKLEVLSFYEGVCSREVGQATG